MIRLRRIDLQHFEDEFTEEEVNAVIQEIAPEKAPGPDGFIGSFYKASWNVIKGDVLAAVCQRSPEGRRRLRRRRTQERTHTHTHTQLT